MQQTETSLRARKRTETRNRIADAALTLALQDGVAATTVDAISAAADVSRRTFFNYFESKDDALINMPDAQEIEATVAGVRESCVGLTLTGVAVRFVVAVIEPRLQGNPDRERRLKLLIQNPHLIAQGFRRFADINRSLASSLRGVAESRGVLFGADPAWADITISAALAAARSVMEASLSRGAIPGPEELEQRANTLLTYAWENVK